MKVKYFSTRVDGYQSIFVQAFTKLDAFEKMERVFPNHRVHVSSLRDENLGLILLDSWDFNDGVMAVYAVTRGIRVSYLKNRVTVRGHCRNIPHSEPFNFSSRKGIFENFSKEPFGLTEPMRMFDPPPCPDRPWTITVRDERICYGFETEADLMAYRLSL